METLADVIRAPWFPAALAIYFVVLVVYYILIARSILQMLRAKANTVLLVFAFLALIPVPPLVITGVVVMIIWSIHNKALATGS